MRVDVTLECLKLRVTKVMKNKEFSQNLEKRTRLFAVSIINLSTLLLKTQEGQVIRNQKKPNKTIKNVVSYWLYSLPLLKAQNFRHS